MTPRFTLADFELAHAAWFANCGPGALAAILNLTLDDVRTLMPDFEDKGYTNPTMMFDALRASSRRWHHIKMQPGSHGPLPWPTFGLVRIQWEGKWMEPQVPQRARYRYTHWVGAATSASGDVGIFDVNALANGSGWCSLEDWARVIVPAITADYKHASGGWHITHAIGVER